MTVHSAARREGLLARDVLRDVVDLARLAPSIHNTQPWWWRIAGDGLELWGDRSRALASVDPEGRDLMVSCGAALHHTLAAAGALGLAAEVVRLPHDGPVDLLARIELAPGTPDPDAGRTIAAIRDRVTDRRRFTSWPVPDQRVTSLARSVGHTLAAAVPVTDVSLRFRVELLLERARLVRAHDVGYLAETDRWIDRSSVDGIPHGAIPPVTGEAGERPHRFISELAFTRSSQSVESTDGLVVVATTEDGPMAWLQAGEALSSLWLKATTGGLSLVPLSQVVEDPASRRSLQGELAAPFSCPQILARIGWQEISRSTLPRTPRRPLGEVLR
jgi:hypothetical protein